MSKKESKMRAIFGSPTKDEMNWNKVNRPKVQEDLSAFKQLPKQAPFIKDENIDLNSYYQPRMQNIYTTQQQQQQQQQQQPLQCSTMLYHSPPSYTVVSFKYYNKYQSRFDFPTFIQTKPQCMTYS